MPVKYREDVKVQGLEPLTALLEQTTALAARDIERRRQLEQGLLRGTSERWGRLIITR
jgi:hypothetical protein